mmetsp:Transcript_16798/g.30456  ORF Transcript_16798/g.30456 Transcript_16798/m.30456 type:complete len:99 (+) Transcript_16798:320-616(+)
MVLSGVPKNAVEVTDEVEWGNATWDACTGGGEGASAGDKAEEKEDKSDGSADDEKKRDGTSSSNKDRIIAVADITGVKSSITSRGPPRAECLPWRGGA